MGQTSASQPRGGRSSCRPRRRVAEKGFRRRRRLSTRPVTVRDRIRLVSESTHAADVLSLCRQHRLPVSHFASRTGPPATSNHHQQWLACLPNHGRLSLIICVNCPAAFSLDWIEQGLTSHPTHYRSYWGRVFLRVK